jgi:four helix bundle protein
MMAAKNVAAREPARSFEDLVVWQKAHQFVLSTYKLTALFPSEEKYGLTQQLRRAAVSIPANIAEGFRRRGRADKARYMNIGEGSLEECRYYLLLARDFGYCETRQLQEQLEKVSRLLCSYVAALRGPYESAGSSGAGVQDQRFSDL